MRSRAWFGGLVPVAATLALVAAGCHGGSAETTTTAASTTTRPTTTTTLSPGEAEPVVPNLAAWKSSGHADVSAEAFRHWDNADPPLIPAACARCHSDPGYRDYIGADNTAPGSVEAAVPPGTVITCITCHNPVADAMTSVVMPSGVELTGLGPEARCIQCHQGRESQVSVAAAVEGLDPDTVDSDLGFINIHYLAAGATQYGTIAKSGYQYPGKTYDAAFQHTPGVSTCVDCHDPHSLQLNLGRCSECHTAVTSAEDTHDIRMPGSQEDYDGDGNITEGIYYEVEGVRNLLYSVIRAYALEVTDTAIVYNPDAYPYFFGDTNANGTIDQDEAAFASWTPRLLEAAYNYQLSVKDPGAFAHNAKYVIELLLDSATDLNSVLSRPVALGDVHRIDAGHFAGSEEPFRHWDAEGGVVPGSCSRCHSSFGLAQYLQEGVTVSQPATNGFLCVTCHADLSTFARYEVGPVTFPSGLQADTGSSDSNLCMTCHQGRESTFSVDRAIGDLADDTVSTSLRFVNIHYFAAGATLFGTEVKGAYEYAGHTYLGRRQHTEAFQDCTQCHQAHTFDVALAGCSVCHGGGAPTTFRMTEIDFDGDGNIIEGISGEIETMRVDLIAGMQAYASTTRGTDPIAYDPDAYPYFFVDANGNGVVDDDETTGYSTWTPRLLRASYNVQFVTKDPGGYAHNPLYLIQVLYDSLTDVGYDTSAMTRP
jgi:hypothetical protein